MPLNNSNNNNIKRLEKKELKINIRNFFLQKESSQKNINFNLIPPINLSKKSNIKTILQNNSTSTNNAELPQNDKKPSQNSSISDFFLSKQDKTLQELLKEDNYLKQNNEFKVEKNDNLKQNNKFTEDTSLMHYLNSFLKTGNSLEEFIDIDQVDCIYNQEIEFSNLYNEIKNIYGNTQLSLEKDFTEKINQNDDLKNYSNQIYRYILSGNLDESKKSIENNTKKFIEKFIEIYSPEILNETFKEIIKLQKNFNEELSNFCSKVKKFIDDNNNLKNKQKISECYEGLLRKILEPRNFEKKIIILFISSILNKYNQIIIENLEECCSQINLSNQEYKNDQNQINSDILKELSEIPNPFEIQLTKDGLLDVDYYFNDEYKKDQTKRFPLSDNEYKNKLNNVKEYSLDSSEILISPQYTIDDLESITELLTDHLNISKKNKNKFVF